MTAELAPLEVAAASSAPSRGMHPSRRIPPSSLGTFQFRRRSPLVVQARWRASRRTTMRLRGEGVVPRLRRRWCEEAGDREMAPTYRARERAGQLRQLVVVEA